MSRYDPKIEKELSEVLKRVASRKADYQLNEVDKILKRWKKNTAKTGTVLTEIRHIMSEPLLPASFRDDPGMALAEAMRLGFLSKKDLSEDAWRAVEVVMTAMDL